MHRQNYAIFDSYNMARFSSSQILKIFNHIGFLLTNTLSVVQSGVLPIEFMHESLRSSYIVPDAYTEAANYGIEIWFGHDQVEYGNHISVEKLQQKPSHVNWIHNSKDRFTLIMTGLDAPSSDDPHDREVLYWMVGNIPETDIKAGEQWAAYVPPWTLGGTGPHRILFTVYKQNNGRKIIYRQRRLGHRVMGDERKKFSTRKFGEKYKLHAPWAANFFNLVDNSSSSSGLT